MVARFRRAWATPAKAMAYETHFRTAVLPHLEEVSGFPAADLLSHKEGTDTE